MKPQAILDIESFPNFFLVKFLRVADDFMMSFSFSGENTLKVDVIMGIIAKYEIITFNGVFYDIPVLRLALKGANSQTLKMASNQLIAGGMRVYEFEEEYQLRKMNIDFIDLIEIAPGDASLKLYMGRLHSKRIQDLPYPHDKFLTSEEMKEVDNYCGNDLLGTKELLMELTPQIDLRRKMSEQYNLDLRSKSDAQIAEAVIRAEVFKKTKRKIAKAESIDEFQYQLPEFVRIVDEGIYEALSEPFLVGSSGKITMPKKLADLKINIGRTTYQMGMGGLHSTEKSVHHHTDDNYILCDYDVASYYPTIILNAGMYPRQLGPEFLEVYQELVTARLAGKKAKNMVIADSLRIAINGSFGKLGSIYSCLYAPDLLVQVTVTGQLCLLMLIYALEKHKIPVVSGNTDGIVVKCPRDMEEVMQFIVSEWEEETGFTMERTDYSAIYSRDVNNYIAVKANGSVKTKGCFKVGGIMKNPTNEVCNLALVEYLTKGISFSQYVTECKDITKFISLRTVQGGAVQGNEYLGKVVRWYYAKDWRKTINYKTTGNTVPKTQGARPLMEFGEFPKDIDYSWYIRECNTLLEAVGMRGPNGQQSLF